MVEITAPNENLIGIVAGVPFMNGTAIIKDQSKHLDHVYQWFIRKGYRVEGYVSPFGNTESTSLEDDPENGDGQVRSKKGKRPEAE